MNLTRTCGIFASSAIVLAAASAHAQTTPADAPTMVKRSAAVMMIGSGNEKTLGRQAIDDAINNDTNRRAGPGFEQSTVAHVLGPDGAHYVVVLVMESVYRTENVGPYQISCSSFRLNEKGSPTMTTARKFMTQHPGNRPANHPIAKTFGKVQGSEYGKYVAYAYGSQMGTNRTKTYFGITNHQCDKLLPDTKISSIDNEANNDRGAPDIAIQSDTAEGATVSFAYFSNGTDKYVYYGLLDVKGSDGLFDVKSRFEPQIVHSPTNIGRPALVADGPERSVICAAVDGNRPAYNTACARVEATTGRVIFKDYIAKGVMSDDPYQRKYMGGGPSIALAGKPGEGKFFVQYLESNGAAKNGNQRDLKGSSKSHLLFVEVNPGTEALVIRGEIKDAAVHPTHSAVISGRHGVDGKLVANVISAPPTGIGRAHMLMLNFDGAAATPFTYDTVRSAWPINYNGDSGYLANMFGDQPSQQGRDFMRGIGDVPNPGYHVAGGFMPDVKTFWAAAIPGREVGVAKNSLYLSLLPAETDTPGTPGNPVNAQDVPLQTPTTPSDKVDEPKGCACSTPGSGNRADLLGGLALVGLVVAGMRLRKRS